MPCEERQATTSAEGASMAAFPCFYPYGILAPRAASATANQSSRSNFTDIAFAAEATRSALFVPSTEIGWLG